MIAHFIESNITINNNTYSICKHKYYPIYTYILSSLYFISGLDTAFSIYMYI